MIFVLESFLALKCLKMTLRVFADDMEAKKPRVIPETVKVDAIEEAAQKYACATPLLKDFYLAMAPNKIIARLNIKTKLNIFWQSVL